MQIYFCTGLYVADAFAGLIYPLKPLLPGVLIKGEEEYLIPGNN